MIEIKNFRDLRGNESKYDEIWAIVRSMKSSSNKIKQVTSLSPSLDLFFKYRSLAKNNNWNKKTFQEIYVPQFISELKTGPEKGYELLNQLYFADKAGKKICLICFCGDEELCHRSIIAGLLQGVGCDVKTEKNTNYSKYFEMYK